MKVLGITGCDQKFLKYAQRVEFSFKYFHPDCDFLLCMAEDYMPIFNKIFMPPCGWNQFTMMFTVFVAYWEMVSKHYDLVIRFDADTVITGKLEEMLIGDYDIAISNSSANTIGNFPNAGVWSTTSAKFLSEFFFTNWMSCQPDNWVFDFVLKRSNWGKKWLDNENVWYNERSRQWWDRLYVKEDKLYTPDREVKVLHWASAMWGDAVIDNRMSCSLFTDEVKQWLNKITGTTTFTDYDGIKFGEFLKSYYKL